jgi:hypothetical protein
MTRVDSLPLTGIPWNTTDQPRRTQNMDAGIADTLNRRAVQAMVAHLDKFDIDLCANETGPWYATRIADTLMGTNDATNADRAWLVGVIAQSTPGLDFDGHPADCDWENFYSHLRAEILARRDPKTPPAVPAETRSGGVV